MTAVQYKLDVM